MAFFDEQMMALFKEVLVQLSQSRIKTMFGKRLKNIANTQLIHDDKKLTFPCVYFQQVMTIGSLGIMSMSLGRFLMI